MRKPTDPTELYFWWECALAGMDVKYHENQPECGWFKTREKLDYRQYGPWLPVKIWLHSPTDENGFLDGDEELRAYRDGEAVDPQDIWVWCCRYPITEEEYELLAFERAMQKEVA